MHFELYDGIRIDNAAIHRIKIVKKYIKETGI